jgi:butyrate kinase
VDEMQDIAKVAGHPAFQRVPIFPDFDTISAFIL